VEDVLEEVVEDVELTTVLCDSRHRRRSS
jgi:hypothetical protein